MSYRHEFNTHASAMSQSAREAKQSLDVSGANPDIVEAMHEALDLPKAPTTDIEMHEFQNIMRDLAEASGAEGASGGRILSGAAATAVSNKSIQSEEEKKKREDARFLDTLLAMRADLVRRIGDLDRQYHEAMQKSQEHFDKANEADDLANKIEDGTATPEEIERAREIMGIDKDTKVDPQKWSEGLREIRDIQNRFGLKEAERAQRIQEKAEELRQEREELDQGIDRIQARPEAERPVAAKQLVEKMAEKGKSIDLDSDKLSKAPEIREAVDSAGKELKNQRQDDVADSDFETEIELPMPGIT